MIGFKAFINEVALVKMLVEDKASLIMSQIREISNKDAQFNNYPRFKKMDDSTVIVASLKYVCHIIRHYLPRCILGADLVVLCKILDYSKNAQNSLR